jgi:ribonuclease R
VRICLNRPERCGVGLRLEQKKYLLFIKFIIRRLSFVICDVDTLSVNNQRQPSSHKKTFKKLSEGLIKRHPDGFGFFIPDDTESPDVYVPRQSMAGAMTGDRVSIEVFPERGGARFRGEIKKILKRGLSQVVGVYSKGYVKDDGKGWGEDLKIESTDTMGAKDGELVSAEITSYPESGSGFRGKVRDVLGDATDPLTDVKRVLFQHMIPQEFPQAVEHEANQFTELVSPKDQQGRKNLRALNFITIDGATAKDFDDAIFVKSSDKGFVLYVAIADVSHYVRPGSAIDREAYLRGTSVYFPNFVVPMLPEVLSNGLCSLNPHLPRLSLVAEMHMDFTGHVYESHFYEAVIESKSRVTYGEAQQIIDGEEVAKHKHVQEEILMAADLAKILMAKRSREGSLDLEIPETQIVLDATGVPTDFIRTERLFAHRLIEEMMLAANVAVARFISEKEIAGLYRIHEPPNADAIAMLEKYLIQFGSKLNLAQGKLQKRLTRALQEFEGKPEAQILNILTLRSMTQAKYSDNNLGHFGLGFEFYTHFTSPIRRYPDLIIHRLVKSLVMPKSGYKQMSEDELATAGTMLSATEQRSVKAERQFQSIKKARFLKMHLGEEFDGIISSVTKFGVFVLLRQFEVDGLIRVENLSKEKLDFDEESLALIGKKTGTHFGIGDLVKIQVAAADPESGQVDFHLVSRLNLQTGESVEDEAVHYPRHQRPSREQKSLKGKPQQARGQKRDRGDRKEALKNKRPQSPRPEPRSKKLQAIEKMEKNVIEFLTEANQVSQQKGEKFDAEKHLQNALAKWRERNGDRFVKGERVKSNRNDGEIRRVDRNDRPGKIAFGKGKKK